MAKVEVLRKSRKVSRSSFTKKANEIDDILSVEPIDREELSVHFELLRLKFEDLKLLNSEIYELILADASEDDLIAEIDGCDVYMKRFAVVRNKCEKLQGDADRSERSSSGESTSVRNSGMRKFKLPTIEFKRYDGSIKGWLSFWAQFKKIHLDNFIEKSDKIEYLIQATVPGSRARKLVESYPAMDDNYDKIIQSMQSRFGREDLQIEVYIRELLKLILANSMSKQAFDIANLYDQIETQLRALETLGITSDKCSAMLFPLIESCMPNELIRIWQRSQFFNDITFSDSASVKAEDEPNTVSALEVRLKNLMSFLRQEVENEQRIKLATDGFGMNDSKYGKNHKENNVKDKSIRPISEIPTAAGLMNCEVATCVFCSGSHDSSSCFKAQNMTYNQRKEALTQKRACYRCLKIGHQAHRCRAHLRCILCKRRHIVLMCDKSPASQEQSTSTAEVKDTGDAPKHQALANYTSIKVMLQIVRVKLMGPCGEKTVRALIDTGSQRSYILQTTAMQLGYKPKRSERIIHCLFGGREALSTHNCYDITIYKGNYAQTLEVLDEATICGEIAPVCQGQWTEEIKDLDMEISDAEITGPIELLLGADVAGKLYTGAKRELQCGLVAIETQVGWTLMGKVPTTAERPDKVMTSLSLFVNQASISDLWELEAIGIKDPTDKTSDRERETAAREMFLQTVIVNAEGRYEVRLPWIDGHPPLPTNYNLAKKRLASTIDKLKAKNLYEEYNQIFFEWEKEGIVETMGLSKELDITQGHFLPHRPVIKEGSTTRIRPVYDASAHETGKPALNHCLEKGPNLIELIPSMLLRFRENKLAVTSDIRKAFLQIGVQESDRNFLKFLWINTAGEEIVIRHRRVVFGVNSSPFLLGATLEQHLMKFCEISSNSDISSATVQRLRRSFYVDNCVTSLPDEQSLFRFIEEATRVMAAGQFDLRGWEHTGSSVASNGCPILGLFWEPRSDILRLNLEVMLGEDDFVEKVISKRLILSISQKVFDPIGFACATVLVPKILLQKLWKEQLTWDQAVDDVTAQEFRNWFREVHYLSKIRLPRWLGIIDSDLQDLSIHTFCDASQDAYACAVFLRVVRDGDVAVYLLAAKARVAPLKRAEVKMTIPRLELLAATIGARLYTHVKENLSKEIDSYFWTDSSTVVSWIQRNEEWGVFVWNRVTEIRKLTMAERWRHLPGKFNPADLPSRGCSPKQLFESRWWEGPEWLYEAPEKWPCTISILCDEQEIGQERKRKLVNTLLNVGDSVDWHLDYFSKHNKTIRMIAWIFRFIHNCKPGEVKHVGELTTGEIKNAETFVYKQVQQKSFAGETDKTISSLNPFYDEEGVIRLKSRVSRREDTENYRFPILLPAKDFFVKILIMDTHVGAGHVRTQGLLSILREKYWVTGGRRAIRAVISKCVICKRFDAKPLDVESPPLPMDRVRDAVAFEVTGVDFAGPLFLKNGSKAWICLFTCAVYRAVHLELVSSLSTQNFMQALRRFVSRRGRPQTIYSDNGTNFRGAENAFARLDWDCIERDGSIQRITWRFNPPSAPWWGGFWERLIGVLKPLLRKILGRASLDYEDLLTVLCDCETVINSRPITYLSEDVKDLVALTPSMFLREQVLAGLPDCDAVDRSSLCKKMRKIQTLREDLRSRFRVEYLGQLKLFGEKRANRDVVIGEIVLVGNDNDKRIDWPIARVIEVLPGRDGKTRLVRLDTPRGTLLRPLQRLYPLECTDDALSPEFSMRARANLEEELGSGTEEVPDPQERNKAEIPQVKTTRSGRASRMPRRFQ